MSKDPIFLTIVTDRLIQVPAGSVLLPSACLYPECYCNVLDQRCSLERTDLVGRCSDKCSVPLDMLFIQAPLQSNVVPPTLDDRSLEIGQWFPAAQGCSRHDTVEIASHLRPLLRLPPSDAIFRSLKFYIPLRGFDGFCGWTGYEPGLQPSVIWHLPMVRIDGVRRAGLLSC